MSAKANSLEGERLDVLAALVQAYERKHYPLDLPDPVQINHPRRPSYPVALAALQIGNAR